jgi:hypothetical protein
MSSQPETTRQANAQAAFIKQLQRYFNPVNQLKQWLIRLSKWLLSALI